MVQPKEVAENFGSNAEVAEHLLCTLYVVYS